MAQLLVNHFFHLYGLPLGKVSVRGPQFMSQVWKTFSQALGATASLSSGYHPQTNGQSKYTNQELESAFCCQTSWSFFPGWSMPTTPQVCPLSWLLLLPYVQAHLRRYHCYEGLVDWRVTLLSRGPGFFRVSSWTLNWDFYWCSPDKASGPPGGLRLGGYQWHAQVDTRWCSSTRPLPSEPSKCPFESLFLCMCIRPMQT